MSTHANIAIEGAPFVLYLHHDGYPRGVLPLLLPFLAEFTADRGHDAEYLAPRLVQAITNALDARHEDIGRRTGRPNPYRFTGVGLASEYQGDIRWSYFVTAEGTVKVYRTFLFDSKVAVLRKPATDPQGREGFTYAGTVVPGQESPDLAAVRLEAEPSPA